MKKILLLFAILPVLSFAQEKQKITKFPPSSLNIADYENNRPAYFVDGKEAESEILGKLNRNDVKSITIIKNDPKYPQGKIDIYMKK